MGNYVASNLGNSRLVGAITESTKTISIQVADIFKFPVVNNGGVGWGFDTDGNYVSCVH